LDHIDNSTENDLTFFQTEIMIANQNGL
jgi:hypothetical protein